jgi:hypothetical protein
MPKYPEPDFRQELFFDFSQIGADKKRGCTQKNGTRITRITLILMGFKVVMF